MAAKSTTETETPQDSVEGIPEAAKPTQGLLAVLLPPAILAIVLGAVGFALAYFVVPSRMQAAAATPTAAPATAATAVPVAPADEKTKRSPEELAASGGKAVTKFTIEEVTVNIADTRGNRFVRAGIFFEAAPAVLEELEANRPRMVDTLGQVLSTKTLDQLTSPNIRGDLREELLGIINPTLKAGRIDNLYFTDLLVQ